MKRRLFLISNFGETFEQVAERFIDSCGGKNSRIACLMQGEKNWEKHFAEYRQLFRKLKQIELNPVFPDQDYKLSSKMMDELKRASGIFTGGGYMYRYIKAYTEESVKRIIFQKYQEGTPYAGLSAGAILPIRLGILPRFAIKPHFTEKNRFAELLKKMTKNKTEFGLGLDDDSWLEIENENMVKLLGKGNCYVFQQKGLNKFRLQVLNAGDSIEIVQNVSR